MASSVRIIPTLRAEEYHSIVKGNRQLEHLPVDYVFEINDITLFINKCGEKDLSDIEETQPVGKILFIRRKNICRGILIRQEVLKNDTCTTGARKMEC
eukprot:snap_masked-scaffold_22-processed-gene-0.37-mRNA-1 protein AED:1.00 eAED:1.00 QI:0/-1/0/0/-1/1/1/0/97